MTETKHVGVNRNNKSIWELCPGAVTLNTAKTLADKGLNVNILAMGDVGATLLLGLKIMGSELIDTIGIFDVNEKVTARYEMEMNQIGSPFGGIPMPKVKILSEDELFNCDMFVFCASRAVPPIGTDGDVRMMQLEANGEIASHYGSMAKEKNFQGIFAVVSDPVDPLCKKVLRSSELLPGQVRGYGLGVMNKRAEYFAKKDSRFESYLTEGRAFGPHGSDLIIANSIENYEDEISKELTSLTVEANLRVRELGFKPYIAPAISSGAISLILTLRGEWNYSSVYLGDEKDGAFLGIRNRIRGEKTEIEDIPLPYELYDRIEKAYANLCRIE